jgi:hypothetical protein
MAKIAAESDLELVAAFAEHTLASAHGDAHGLGGAAQRFEAIGALLPAAEAAATHAIRGAHSGDRDCDARYTRSEQPRHRRATNRGNRRLRALRGGTVRRRRRDRPEAIQYPVTDDSGHPAV